MKPRQANPLDSLSEEGKDAMDGRGRGIWGGKCEAMTLFGDHGVSDGQFIL
jgi:hypothetical protein